MTIRRLAPDDAALYRALRLRGLRESPGAFGTGAEEDERRTVGDFDEALRRNEESGVGFTLGAFDEGGGLVGVVGLHRDARAKARHRAVVRGMFVAPEARRRGVGLALMQRLIVEARAMDGLERITLGVTTASAAPLRLYESLGFRPFGLEPRTLKIAGRYLDTHHMTLDLGGDY